jgi:hypothetical protein
VFTALGKLISVKVKLGGESGSSARAAWAGPNSIAATAAQKAGVIRINDIMKSPRSGLNYLPMVPIGAPTPVHKS